MGVRRASPEPAHMPLIAKGCFPTKPIYAVTQRDEDTRGEARHAPCCAYAALRPVGGLGMR